MQAVELCRYLGISYAQLLASPQWLIDTAAIRMHEEAEYQAHLARQAEKKR